MAITLYDNLKKVISWTLPTNADEAMSVILAVKAKLKCPVFSKVEMSGVPLNYQSHTYPQVHRSGALHYGG